MTPARTDIEFVFIQLGEDLPSHLFQNLILVHQMFPLTRINLVTSKRVVIGSDIADFVSQTEYESSPELDKLLNVKSRNLSFRNGFWRFSLERLFAIAYLHEKRPDKSLLHIESDVLLLQGFPLENFTSVEKIAWMSVDSKKDIASLMFFPDVAASQIFLDDLVAFVTNAQSPTDMTALNHLRLENPNKYCLLPTWNRELPKLHSNLNTESLTESVFGAGIFDAAGIGMWLTGFDPRTSYGFVNYFATKDLRNAEFFVDPSAYTLEFSEDGTLFYRNGPSYIQVYNLHIHSKSMRLFSINRIEELSRLTRLSNRGRPHREFFPQVLAGLIMSNFREGTLLAFLFYSPPFKILRLAYGLTKKFARGL
jgi:hypothetical protein